MLTENWTDFKSGLSGLTPQPKRSRSRQSRGRWVTAEHPNTLTGGFELAVAATLKAAARRRGGADTGSLVLIGSDLRRKVRLNLSQRLILFVVDASDSMGGGTRARMSLAKAAVLGLLQHAYLLRSRVALISFHDRTANLLLPPTASIDLARARLRSLAVGGATPLAAGLWEANKLLLKNHYLDSAEQTSLVLLSDGEANVPLDQGADIYQEVVALGHQLRAAGTNGLIFDTGPSGSPSELLLELAKTSGLPYHQRGGMKAGQLLTLLCDSNQSTDAQRN